MTKASNEIALVWLRRDLRLHDNAALAFALKLGKPVQVVFVFDSDILEHFPSKDDRRLSFIADTLCTIDKTLNSHGGKLLILHGSATKVIPELAHILHASHLFASEDYEPETRTRDQQVTHALEGKCVVQFVKDHVIFAPEEIIKKTGDPYKVFTPYSKAWQLKISPDAVFAYTYDLHKKLSTIALPKHAITARDAYELLEKIGYKYQKDTLWPTDTALKRLQDFIAKKAASYAEDRNFMAMEATSKISPYLRFGLISIRECVSAALHANATQWLLELIWREFYAMILYHFPESVNTELNTRYRGTIKWSDNEAFFNQWCEGKTGYPLVDAAMRQLVQDGWMHNRARMVVASFLTKHLLVDWRKGEQFFARYLMDYDLSSNVGGWQWAASTGTDAQPYFRIFNPTLQSIKFDKEGKYIKQYVPELKNIPVTYIHEPDKHHLPAAYYPPIVEQGKARTKAIAAFKKG